MLKPRSSSLLKHARSVPTRIEPFLLIAPGVLSFLKQEKGCFNDAGYHSTQTLTTTLTSAVVEPRSSH